MAEQNNSGVIREFKGSQAGTNGLSDPLNYIKDPALKVILQDIYIKLNILQNLITVLDQSVALSKEQTVKLSKSLTALKLDGLIKNELI